MSVSKDIATKKGNACLTLPWYLRDKGEEGCSCVLGYHLNSQLFSKLSGGGRAGMLARCHTKTQPTQKGTAKNKEFSEVTPEAGLSHQVHVIQCPLSHQTVMERLDMGYLLMA